MELCYSLAGWPWAGETTGLSCAALEGGRGRLGALLGSCEDEWGDEPGLLPGPDAP